jgi:hypothetical protein
MIARVITVTVVVALLAAGCASRSPGGFVMTDPDRQRIADELNTTDELAKNVRALKDKENNTGRPRAITYVERTTLSKKPREFKEGQVSPGVDYQSTLTVKVDKDELVKLAAPSGSVLPPLRPEDEARLKHLKDVLPVALKYVQHLKEVGDRVASARLAGPGLSVAERKAVQAAINAQAKEGLALRKPLEEYFKQRFVAADKSANNDEIKAAVAGEMDRFYGGSVAFDTDALVAFIGEETRAAMGMVARDVEAAQEAPLLRIRAVLREPGAAARPVHVRGYDTLEDLDVEQEPRISYVMSEADRKRIGDELKTTDEVAKNFREVRDKKSDLNKALTDLTRAFQADTQALADVTTKLDAAKAKLAALAAAATKAAQSAKLDAAQKKLLGDVQTKINELTKAVDGLKQSASPPADATATSAILDFVQKLSASVDAAVKLATGLGDLGKQAGDIAASITAQVVATDAPNLDELAAAIAPNSLKELTDLEAYFKNKYPNVVATLASIGPAGRALEAQLAAAIPDEQFQSKPVGLDVAGDGLIDLKRNVHSTGGLRITSDFVRADAQGKTHFAKDVDTQEFTIDRYGLVSDWTTSLVFVDRSRNPKGQREVDFDPAPAVAWNLHYRPLPDPNQRQNEFLEALDPGIGMHVAALSWDDGGVQLGLGLQGTFFHNLLQVGYGVNLQADQGQGYFFVGIGLFEAFRDIQALSKR